MLGRVFACQALFDPLGKVAAKCGLDLEKLLEDLESLVRERTKNSLEKGMEQ